MIMKFPALILSALIILSGFGCVSRTAVTTDGRKCRALPDSQIEYLTVMTRNAIIKNAAKHQISAKELNQIRNTPPDLKIQYRGDCFGTLYLTWETPFRVVGMRFEDHLDVRIPQCALILRGTDGKKFQNPPPDRKIPGPRPAKIKY